MLPWMWQTSYNYDILWYTLIYIQWWDVSDGIKRGFSETQKAHGSVTIRQYYASPLRSMFGLCGFVWKCWVNIPKYSHLIGIMIINHWVTRGFPYIFRHTHVLRSMVTFMVSTSTWCGFLQGGCQKRSIPCDDRIRGVKNGSQVQSTFWWWKRRHRGNLKKMQSVCLKYVKYIYIYNGYIWLYNVYIYIYIYVSNMS